VIKPHLDDTLNKARQLWPEALEALPMNNEHKEGLKAHWGKLQDDFKIDTARWITPRLLFALIKWFSQQLWIHRFKQPEINQSNC
jgi:hypothetical protein